VTYNAYENQSDSDCRLANTPLLAEGPIESCHGLPPYEFPICNVLEPSKPWKIEGDIHAASGQWQAIFCDTRSVDAI
jgi:hypothetical protein